MRFHRFVPAAVFLIVTGSLLVSCTDSSNAGSQYQRKVSVTYDFGKPGKSTGAKQSCTITGVRPPKPVRVDWQNARTKTDYFALAISWSPQHCANPRNYSRHRFQCADNRFHFVVHGLWPQSGIASDKFGHPRHCKTGPMLPMTLIKKHLCTVPGAQLMQSQWIKHGSCAFKTPENYFSRIETLWKRLKKPHLMRVKHERMSVGQLKEMFVAANKGMLNKEHIRVWLNRRGYLREVVICYDLNYRYTACALRGAPDSQQVKIRFH